MEVHTKIYLKLDQALVEISTCLLVALSIFMCVYDFWF